MERLLEIVLLRDAVSELILQSEREVAENPEEAWKVHRQLVGVEVLVSTLDLERLGEVDDEAQVVEGVLVDGAHAVVHEQGAHQESQQEDLRVVILLLVEGAKAFGVDDDDGKLLAILLGVEHFLPDPEAFGARVDRGPYLEALESLRLDVGIAAILVGTQSFEKELIQEIRFAGSILAADGHHADLAFALLQELDCLARNFKPLSFRLVLDEGNRDPNTCTRAFTLTAIHAFYDEVIDNYIRNS